MSGKKLQAVKSMIELIKELILAFLAAILIICFIISHTQVPTESMMPTISPGDHLIVNRLPYYYRDPARGEIIVFMFNNDYLIKRVIGVPGDEINIVDDQIYLNGKKLDESHYLNGDIKTYEYTGSPLSLPYVVPEGYYFVMGDNRINSSDSRVIGTISRTSIIAKAELRIWPLGEIGWLE